MTNEQTFFLQALADHLAGEKTTVPADLDWNRLLEYAQSQQVGGMLYHQCKDYLAASPELAAVNQRLSEVYAAHTFYYLNRMALLEQIEKAFTEAQIPYYIVKGSEIARLYPVPALRSMGDTDIVVHGADRPRAHDVLRSLGFENENQGEWEWRYHKNRIEIELHAHLLYSGSLKNNVDLSFVDTAWENMQQRPDETECRKYELNWEFHFVFLLLHLRKHFIYSGVGFRQFMDFAALVKSKGAQMDWESVGRTLTELGIMEFAERCMSCCEKWFCIEMPFSDHEPDAAFAERSEEILFQSGVFGKVEDGADNIKMFEIIRADGDCGKAKVRSISRSLFPPYLQLKRISYYSFVDGRPWLMPVAWLYRFLRAVWKRLFSMKPEAEPTDASSEISAERLQERSSILKQWGIS